jgi:hypothetical protein
MPISDNVINAILKNDPKLTHLDLCESGLSGEDITALVNALQKNTAITSLDLSRNNLDSDDITDLGLLTRIKKINLAQNDVNEAGVNFLLKIPSLNWLNIDDNRLTDEGGKKLVEKSSPSFYISAYGNKKVTPALLEQIERKRTQADPENTPNIPNTTPFWEHSKRSSAPAVLSCANEVVGDKGNTSGRASPSVIEMH